jgi:enoyl-[acyl-carrier protein] reductase I
MLLDLRGKKAPITGIANNKSIAWGIHRPAARRCRL